MTTKTTSLARKITLGLGAVVVSTMALASANQAQAGVKVYLGFGGGYYGGYYGPGYGPGYWGGPGCHFYKHKWKKTGKFYWKKKYFHCMGWW